LRRGEKNYQEKKNARKMALVSRALTFLRWKSGETTEGEELSPGRIEGRAYKFNNYCQDGDGP